jgi:hypothetical protein
MDAIRSELTDDERIEVALRLLPHLQGLSLTEALHILTHTARAVLLQVTPVPEATAEFRDRFWRSSRGS